MSGGELDQLVAEKVMGWQLRQLTLPSGENYWNFVDESGEPQRHIEDWNPSGYADHAMEVLARFPIWNINKTDHPDFADKPYSVTVSTHGPIHSSRIKHFEVQAETVEIGVCRAALKAVDC